MSFQGACRSGGIILLLVCSLLAGGSVARPWAQTVPSSPAPRKAAASPQPIRISMDELHRHGGVPPGWQFTLPAGDPRSGRQAFVDLQCYTCHGIANEAFPPVKATEQRPAPSLTGLGSFHPTAYIVESILHPNAVVVDDPGYTDADGWSHMPSYVEALTVRQLVDLVAYLQSLPAPAAHHHGAGEHPHTHGTAPPAHRHEPATTPARP